MIEREVGDRLLDRGEPPAGHQHEAGRRHQHPDRGDDAGGEEADQVAADDGADRQREQEADQHERGGQLVVGVDRRAREQRDVDERGDQRGADEEADQQRAPGRRTTQGAARHERVGGAAYVPGEGGGGDDGAEEVPPAAGREDLDLGVGGGEGEDHAAEGEGEEQRADEVGLDQHAHPAAEVEQRARARTSTRRASSTSAATVMAPIGVSQRPSPANGMKSRPQVRSRISPDGRRNTTAPPAKVASRRSTPTTSGASRAAASGGRSTPGARARMAAARTRPTARLIAKIARQSDDGEHGRAEERAEHGADLLHGRDDAERDAAALDRVEVGDEREGRRARARRRRRPAGSGRRRCWACRRRAW